MLSDAELEIRNTERWNVAPLEEVCLFLHIPKAAGQTLYRILERNYPGKQNWLFDPGKAEEGLEELECMEYDQRLELRVCRGHFPFGLHQVVNGPCTYVTILRHPVDRMISHYHYVKEYGPGHYLHQAITENGWSLGEYVSSGVSPELDNGQVRLLTDTEQSVPIGKVTREHFEAAKRNLQRWFSVVGTVDRFDEFLLMLQKRFALPLIDYERVNVTKHRPAMASIPEGDRQSILLWNHWDMKLYEYAGQLMERQMKIYGPTLEEDVAELRRKNAARATRNRSQLTNRIWRWLRKASSAVRFF